MCWPNCCFHIEKWSLKKWTKTYETCTYWYVLQKIISLTLLASGDFIHLVINLTNGFDSDQGRQNVSAALDPNRLNVIFCPLCKLNTVKAIWLKHHTLPRKHWDNVCHARTITLLWIFLELFPLDHLQCFFASPL